MATIYKFTNKITGQSYIGKTIRKFQDRYNEHKRDCQTYLANNKTTSPFYNAIGIYGWDNFSLEIVEDNIPNEKINEKEQYYIALYDTHKNGYNATIGGDGGRVTTKLKEAEVKQIVKLLLDKDSLLSIPQIAKEFNVNSSTISNINTGITWYNKTLDYPLRKYCVTGLTIPKTKYSQIILDIQNNNLSLRDISVKYGLSEEQITAINNGYECYNGKHPYYNEIYEGPFPIRSTTKCINIDDKLQDILYDIIFTKNSMAKIGLKYNIPGGTLTCIANGKRRKELTQDFIIPLRKNVQSNQIIYKEKYSKEGD